MKALTKKSTYRQRMEVAIAFFHSKCLAPSKGMPYTEAAAIVKETCQLDDRHLEIAFSAMLYSRQRSITRGQADPIGKAIAMAEKTHG